MHLIKSIILIFLKKKQEQLLQEQFEAPLDLRVSLQVKT